MSLFSSPLAAALAGTGLGCFAIGATKRPDPGLKLTGLAVLAFALAPVPAHADQFVEAADNATIDCELARGELTRIALIDDGFAMPFGEALKEEIRRSAAHAANVTADSVESARKTVTARGREKQT